jgi:predicted transglutaminase-like cysteine proteinase
LTRAGATPAANVDVAFNFDPRLSGFDAAVTLASLLPFEVATPPISRLAEPFGAKLTGPVKGGLQKKWLGVLHKLPLERRILARCRANADRCPPPAKRFLAVIQKALTQDGVMRIAEINRAVNLDVRPVDDMTQYHVLDLWATPLMTFTSNAGDCEDYAIAKYVALQEIGIADEDLRLLVVHLAAKNEDHAVAAVRYDGRWLVLDNRTFEMRDDSQIGEYEPLFALDSEGVKRMALPAAWPPEHRRTPITAALPYRSAPLPRP